MTQDTNTPTLPVSDRVSELLAQVNDERSTLQGRLDAMRTDHALKEATLVEQIKACDRLINAAQPKTPKAPKSRISGQDAGPKKKNGKPIAVAQTKLDEVLLHIHSGKRTGPDINAVCDFSSATVNQALKIMRVNSLVRIAGQTPTGGLRWALTPTGKQRAIELQTGSLPLVADEQDEAIAQERADAVIEPKGEVA